MKPNQNYAIAQVVKFLNENDCFVWRQENNGRIDIEEVVKRLTDLLHALAHVNYDKTKIAPLIKDILNKCYRKVPCSITGVSDVIGLDLTNGRWISVEVKLDGDKMRQDQEVFSSKVRGGGGQYWLVRRVDEFKRAWLLKCRAKSGSRG